MKLSFSQWKAKVDDWLVKHVGLSSDDLPDWGYTDAYNDGQSPATAARSALRAAKEA